jgi:hypothetical protein
VIGCTAAPTASPPLRRPPRHVPRGSKAVGAATSAQTSVDMALGPLSVRGSISSRPHCQNQSESESSGLQFGGCRSHMIWRLIRTGISEGSRRVAGRGPGPVSSALSWTPSQTPSHQLAPAGSAKRICVATGRDSANRVAPRLSNAVV